jgi:hypothetical protein
MDKDTAVKNLKSLRDSSLQMRQFMDSYWTMAIMYDSANQWGYMTTKQGKRVTRRLKEIIDPAREDVRVTMDEIHKNVVLVGSMLKPQRISFTAKPNKPGQADDITNAGTAGKLLKRWIDKSGALDILRRKEHPRDVLGSIGVRRVLTQIGQGVQLSEEQQLRQWRMSWATVYPWEILRDPSAVTTDIDRDEQIIGQVKPYTTEQMKQTFDIDIDTETKISSLHDYQRQVFRAQGGGQGGGQDFVQDSNQTGVLVYECYFKDGPSNNDQKRDWSKQLLVWQDPGEDSDELHVISFGDNPFYGQPFTLFTYDEQIQAPWARGIPHILMKGQDYNNLAFTWIARMMQMGGGKWVFEEGTIDKANRRLNNRVDEPITWKRTNTWGQMQSGPQHVQPPQMNPAIAEVAAAMPQWMNSALNISDVQRGVTSKRGESGRSVEAKLDAANLPIEDMRRTDEIRLSDLLYATLVDLTNPKLMLPATAANTIDADVEPMQLMMLYSDDITKTVRSVNVHPTTLRPQTSTDRRNTMVDLATSGFMEAEEAQWELSRQGEPLMGRMYDARRKQITEIQIMAQGGESEPSVGDLHDYHIKAIQDFTGSDSWFTTPPEVQDMINEHLEDHVEMLNDIQMIMQQDEEQDAAQLAGQNAGQAGMGSPPAMAAEAAALQGPQPTI